MKFAWRALILVVFILFFSVVGKAEASSLTGVSDTLSTSRPSPSSPLSANASSSDGSLSIFDNGSRFLASDSGILIQKGTTNIIKTGIPIASQSSTLTTVYLAGTVGAGAGAGADVLMVPITAMHTVEFTTATTIPIGGTIVIGFPGSGNNTASPSASTFAFNNLSSSNIKANFSSGTATCTFSVNAPTITCTVGTGAVTAGTTVTILIGCSSNSGANCSTQVPTLINPTKGNQTAGAADVWKINITTTDGVSNLDTATVSVGTIESITVRANIDPSLTFTISGINTGTPINNGNTTGCLQTETTNTGINSTATEVNLGTLLNSPTATDTKVGNIAAQLITISTNGANGYVLTATSSGHLRNPSTGYFLSDATTPQAFPASGANFFGFHACGLDTYNSDIGTTFWNSTASNTACNSYISGSTGNLCKYGWPTTSTQLVMASDTSGPIGNSLTAGNGLTSVSYAAGADAGVPPGQYSTVVTYIVTPAF
jgi:hypothetical protein